MNPVKSITTTIAFLAAMSAPVTAQTSTAMPADPDDPTFQEWCISNWDDCKVAVKIGMQQRNDLMKLTYADCVRLDICVADWAPPPVRRDDFAPSAVALTSSLSFVDNADIVPSQVIGISDKCKEAMWVDGSVPPECLGPIKNILIQSGRALK